MKQSVYEGEFVDAFSIRPNNFSYAGLQALYEYLTQLEDDIGEEIELDVIAFCCEYTEYEDAEEFVAEHSGYDTFYEWFCQNADEDEEKLTYSDEFEANIDELKEKYFDDYREELMEEIERNTTVIDIDGTSFIIRAY